MNTTLLSQSTVCDTLVCIVENQGITLAEVLTITLNFAMLLTYAYISYKAWQTFREHNRPFITFNLERGDKPKQIFLVIRNTGNRGARDVRIEFSPPLHSVVSDTIDGDGKISFQDISFIAPTQEIIAFFDGTLALEEYSSTHKYRVTIKYAYKKRRFEENYDIDLSYLKHFNFVVKPPLWGVR